MQEQLLALNHQSYNKINLSKHIGVLLQTIANDQPADPIGCFEEMSRLLWKQRRIQDNEIPPGVDQTELDQSSAVLGLLSKLESPSRKKLDTTFFDMLPKWAQSGISMSKDSSLMLQCSLIGLAEREEIAEIRFWGIFETPAGSIYVAEADIPLEFRNEDAPTVGQYDVPPEVGVGVNRWVYYITKSPFDQWVRLPDLRPSDIVNSRKVIWQLSGDLSAAVRSFVPFDVTEDIYMRTLIARITSAATVAPQGYIMEYQPEEEEQDEPEQEEGEEDGEKVPEPKQLKLVLDPSFEGVDIDGIEWCHVRPFILQQGRESYIKPPKPPKQPKVKPPKPEKIEGEEEEGGEEDAADKEAEEEDAPEEEEQPEEGPELFGSTADDEGFGEDVPCWNTRTYNSPIPNESFVVVENLRWPGAFSITDGKKACSIYVGTGTKFVIDGFQPIAPPNLATEYRLKMKERIDPTLDEERENERLRNPPKEEEEEEEQNE